MAGVKKFHITKSFLVREYTDNKKSADQIAKEFGCGETTIWDRLKKFNIPRRHRSEYSYDFSIEHREKLSEAKQGKWRGSTNPNWRGGTAQDHQAIRKHITYTTFRKRVLRMKGKQCEACGKDLLKACKCCGHKPDRHVHHPHKFSDNPKIRFDLSNAVVLCESCHKSLHKK